MNRIGVRAALVSAALAFAQPALATWPTAPTEGVPVCVMSGDQGHPAMSPDGVGGACFAWLDWRAGWPELRYRVQRLDEHGDAAYPAGGALLSDHRVPGDQPALVSGGSVGGAIAVWRDFRADTAGNLYAQRLMPGDTAAWGANGVPVITGPLHEREMAAAPDGEGGLFVAWTDDRDGPLWQVRAQHVSAAGARLWDETGILVAPWASVQRSPRLAPDGEGGVVVAWNDTRGPSANAYAQRLSGQGVAQWTAGGVKLSTSTLGVAMVDLAADGRGGAYAAFFDNRSQNSWQQAYAQHVDRTGAIAWAGDGLGFSGATWPVQQVEVCEDGAGGVFVGWRDYENGGNNYVFLAHADSAGASPASTTVGYGYDGNGFLRFGLEPDGSGGALVAWNGQDGDAFSVWAQRLDVSLAPAWVPGGAKAAHSSGANYGPRAVGDNRGGAILGWKDWGPNWGSDVFAAHLNAIGQPGPAGVPTGEAPQTLALSAGPSPARAGSAVTLRLAMPAPGGARIELLDVSGRRVAVLRGSAGAPGVLVMRWDGRDAAGRNVPAGIYFARAEVADRTTFARIAITN